MFDLIIKKTNQLHRLALRQAVKRYQASNGKKDAHHRGVHPSVAIIVSVKNILLYFPTLIFNRRPCILYYTGMGRLYLFGGKWLILLTAYLLDRLCAVGFIVENQENKAILENIVRQPVYQVSGSGLHVEQFQQGVFNISPVKKKYPEIITLGYMSRFHVSKYTNLIVELAENLPDNVRLMIAGKDVGFGTYEKKFEIMCQQNPNILFLDYLRHPLQINNFYRKVDWLLYPSMREGLPLSLLEAIWHDVPFITTPVCGCEELAELFNCPTVVPENFVDFIRQGKYLQHPLDKNAWQTKIQPFYSDNVSHEFEEILQIVAQHPRLQA